VILHDPPDIPPFEPQDIPSCLTFDRDEDFILLLFLRLDRPVPFRSFIQEWLFVFKPFRSADSIVDRIEFLRRLSTEFTDEFFESYAQSLLSEELASCAVVDDPEVDRELFSHSICSFLPEFPIEPTCEVKTQLDSLQTIVPGLSFSSDLLWRTLAILRSEKNQYFMRREALLIGRGTVDHPVDVDLTFESDRTCTHISRMQAILAFMEDGHFYLENVGHRVLRVNGRAIEAGQICQLTTGALLDFSGTLLIFIPNDKLVKEIRVAYEAFGSPRRR
jgi:hypothetical protein